MPEPRTVSVTFHHTRWILEGTWTPYIPAVTNAPAEQCHPAEGGHFGEDFRIYPADLPDRVREPDGAGGTVDHLLDWYEILNETAIDEIVKLAEEAAAVSDGKADG